MEIVKFEITIEADQERVWKTLWNDATYPIWTAVFSPGSHAKTDWQEGSKVLFLGAENQGMVSKILTKKDNEFMSFQHVGMIDDNGNEDTESDKVKAWAGSLENYYLHPQNGATAVWVELDIDNQYKDYFQKTWPAALQRLKEVAEDGKLHA